MEGISHGDVGHVGWNLVLLAESLEFSSGEAVEIHLVLFVLIDRIEGGFLSISEETSGIWCSFIGMGMELI